MMAIRAYFKKSVGLFADLVKKNRAACALPAVFMLLAVLSYVNTSGGSEAFTVSRGEEGSADESLTFEYIAPDGTKGELTIDVSALKIDEDEAMLLLDEAMEEWEEEYLADNPSEDEVSDSLYLPESMCEGLVEVKYSSSDYTLLDPDGTILTQSLPDEGKAVTLTAEFTCGEYLAQKTCFLYLVWPKEGSAEWIYYKLKSAVEELEASSRLYESFSLPESIEGYKITWVAEENRQWMIFALIGAAAFFCLILRDKENEKKAKKKRDEQLLSEYPGMVGQLSMLLAGGMSIRGAWERIIDTSKALGAADPSYGEHIYIEEMEITLREMEGGWPQKAAFERFGMRIGLIPYRRFSSILSQNLSKGSQDVRELLKAETREAFEMRKNQAKRLGEEAGTKLLFPMMLIFVLLIAVLMVPAIMSF